MTAVWKVLLTTLMGVILLVVGVNVVYFVSRGICILTDRLGDPRDGFDVFINGVVVAAVVAAVLFGCYELGAIALRFR